MKLYTFGYIAHDSKVHEKYLGPCLKSLEGEFDVLKTSSAKCPASNYNDLIDMCQTPYLILTHQDVSFPPNLLRRISHTIIRVPNFGALGMVGVNPKRQYFWSSPNKIFKIETLDSCFLVIQKNLGIRFDDIVFDEFHQYVEDYCAQLTRKHNLPCYTILVKAMEANPSISLGSCMQHHSNTMNKLGACWGKWQEYNRRLMAKWPGIKTT